MDDPLVDLHRFLWAQIQALQADLSAARQRIAELEAAQDGTVA